MLFSIGNSISACPKNWKDCTMCVQDLISLHVNITAEITKQEVDNFMQMCKIFAKQLSKCYVECSAIAANTPSTSGNIAQLIPNLKQDDDLVSLIEKGILPCVGCCGNTKTL